MKDEGSFGFARQACVSRPTDAALKRALTDRLLFRQYDKVNQKGNGNRREKWKMLLWAIN
ncbi:MAG: hypothetical protein LLG00_10365 [Planctomycetaceae bacterium]|nr:hypothetical protein [Planctomycetaceae bacterium]